MTSHSSIVFDVPLPSLNVTLQKHQQTLVRKMIQTSCNLIFVAGTGSGKTISAIITGIGLLYARKITGVHIVTPKSVYLQFKHEIHRIVPDTMLEKFSITTHTLYFSAKMAPYRDIQNKLLVIDEAHSAMSKLIETNHTTGEIKSGKLSYFALEASRHAKQVLLLTATPLKNKPEELFNLFCAVQQKPYHQFYAWVRKWQNILHDQYKNYLRTGNTNVIQQTNRMLGWYAQAVAPNIHFARRTLVTGFPSVTTKVIKCTMNEEYLAIYNAIEKKRTIECIEKINQQEQRIQLKKKGKQNGKVNEQQPLQFLLDPSKIDRFYTTLRQSVNGCTANVVSEKIKFAIQILSDSHRNKQRSLLYSFFIDGGLRLVSRCLRNQNIPFVEITGDTSTLDRENNINMINDGALYIILISKAASEGIDLQGIRNVILLEPHFHETLSKQVIGRAIRYKSHDKLPISERHVTIYRLLLSKPTTTGKSWEDIEMNNANKLQTMIKRYARMNARTSYAKIELTLSRITQKYVQDALGIYNPPLEASIFKYNPILDIHDHRILIRILDDFILHREPDEYDDMVELEDLPNDLSVDDILSRMATRKEYIIEQHLKLLRRYSNSHRSFSGSLNRSV